MVLLHDVGQSLAHLLVHAIFSTKDRQPFLGFRFAPPQAVILPRLRRLRATGIFAG